MCLGEVVQLVEVRPGGQALARTGTRTVPVSLLTLDDPVGAGDWVLVHSGFALSRLSSEEALEAIALRSTASTGPPTQALSSAAGAAAPSTPLEGSV